MNFSRRDFLKSSLVALGSTVPVFVNRTAAQTPSAVQAGARDTILVVIQMTGGNDGLNTVIPYANEEYGRLRPTLKQPANQVRRINDEIGLHPAMTELGNLLEDNALCVLQGVGYPNPTQSHFLSMDIWHAANTETQNDGWIGRGLRHVPGAASFHLAEDNESSPLALTGAPVRVPSITALEDFQLRVEATNRADRNQQLAVIEGFAQPQAATGSLLDFVQRTSMNTYASSRRLQEIGRAYQPRVAYPATPLANKLRLAAQLIDAGVGARLFYVSIGGFDTHSNQGTAHANLLRQVSDAMSAFFRDMSQRGQRDRILMMTFSEFGRRARENGSQGTDHGAAAPMLLVGGRVQSGLVGAHPSLTNLDAGNFRHHTDFRQVYATILDRWLGIPSRQVLGGDYRHVECLRG